jgi:hypothetical protein
MITFRDPPPLEVRVRSLKETATAPPTFDAPVVPWAIGMFVIIVLGIAAGVQQRSRTGKELLAAAVSNSLPREVERGVLTQLPIGTSMRQVRARIGELRLPCRDVTRAARGDSVLACLGMPIVRENTFAQLAMRFKFRNDELVALTACPGVVHWKTRAVPADIAQRLASQTAGTCWRDETNPADNEWTYGIVPDRPFTVARVHAADTVIRRATPTADTLVLDW